METLQIITIIDDNDIENQIRTPLVDALADEIDIINFPTPSEALAGIRSMGADQITNIALLIFSFRHGDSFEQRLVELNDVVLPECRKMVILNSEDASRVMDLSNRISLDKFSEHPLSHDVVRLDVEQLIEKFLEHKILRRSLDEVRQTYDAMKEQYQAVKEANLRLDRKILELSTLSEIGRDLMATYNRDDIFRGTVLTLIGQKGASTIILFFLNEGEKLLEVKAHRGIPQDHNSLIHTIPRTSNLLDDLFREAKPKFVKTLEISPQNQAEFAVLSDLSAEIIIPLLNKGDRKGFILLGPKVNLTQYSENDFEFFSILANQMVFALDNALLYMKLEAKIAELEEANQELRQLDLMKSEFITIASHELRTPLTAIRGYSELLLATKFGSLTEKQHKAIGVVNKNVDRLIKISDDVVQLSKIDANRLSINLIPSTLKKIIADIVEEMKPIAQARNLSLHFNRAGDSPVVLVDLHLMNQAFSELINNGIRFTQDGGTIAIKISTILSSAIPPHYLPDHAIEHYVKVSIQDDGIGIPTEEYEKIFDRFYEVQHSDFHHSGLYEFKSGGTGLGLAVVKGIIQKHGGSIWVLSGLEKGQLGSEFIFVLPVPSFSDSSGS